MSKNIKQIFDQIVAFQAENPEQTRSGCLYEQDAASQVLRDYVIQDEVFKKCNFYTTKFIACKFIGCSFLECNFSAAEFINCKFINCTINNSIFTDAILMDTQFKDCAKANNVLDHLHCSGLTKGLTAKDENIMQDEIVNEDEETAMQKDLKTVFTEKITKIMSDNFPKWEIEKNENDYPSFVYSDPDNIIGLVLYADQEKNSTDTDNFWCLSIYFKDDTLLTSDFNFFGLEADAITSIINDWQKEVLKDNASTILERILNNLK